MQPAPGLPGAFNERTALVIGLPVTAACNATHPFAPELGAASPVQRRKTSGVLWHQPKFFDGRARGAPPHGLGRFDGVCLPGPARC